MRIGPQLLLLAIAVAGCRSAFEPTEPLPVEIAESESLTPSEVALAPDEVVARVTSSIFEIEVEPRIVKPFGEYAHDVGTSFVGMLTQPLTAPLFLFELFLGWLDFSTTYGSGFVVDSRGHLVTNAHVVEDAREVSLSRADGFQGRAKVVARDDEHDLALLRVVLPPGKSLAPDEVLPLGRSGRARLGERVVLYGFPGRPFEQRDAPQPTVTAGIVSSLDIDAGRDGSRMQLDATANAGSSGCPVLDDHGRVIGVVTEVADPSSYAGETFAIPIDDVVRAFFRRVDR